ncbi:Glucose N-acetyltransferase 1 [Sesbania bispinosa]|nr:Glucose N-acetyltransferase 1 [Sesbania bispinosa]
MMVVKNAKSYLDSSSESLPKPTTQPSSTQTQTRPPSNRLRSGVLKSSTPSEPIHIDLIEERR